MSISIQNRTKQRLPRVDFSFIADKTLGKSYELSLVFCGSALMRRLNRTYRDKDKTTNVLAFPLSKDSGEIFINLSYLKNFSVPYLFIHALLHLKGHSHGDTMEKIELKLLKQFSINKNGTPNSSRH